VQEFLQITSAIGSNFDESTIELILNSKGGDNEWLESNHYWEIPLQDVNMLQILEELVAEAYITNHRGGDYKFVHDKIQQAAYSLIPEEMVGL